MLLDTHVWIWTATGDERRVGPRTRRRLAKAAGTAPVFVSSLSAFEIAALHTAGRLQFTIPAERWIRESIAAGGLRVIDVTTGIAIDAGLVGASALADPIDRGLVATAREYRMPIVTRDARILTYAARTGLVQVIDASA